MSTIKCIVDHIQTTITVEPKKKIRLESVLNRRKKRSCSRPKSTETKLKRGQNIRQFIALLEANERGYWFQQDGTPQRDFFWEMIVSV